MAEPFDRVMQLNLLYFCGICQLIPLKVWPNTALVSSHQSTYSLYVQLLLAPNVLPRRNEGSDKPSALIKALQYISPPRSGGAGFEPGRLDSKS